MVKRVVVSDQKVRAAAKKAKSAFELIRLVGRPPGGASYRWVNKTIERLGIDTTHWVSRSRSARERRPLSFYLTRNSKWKGTSSGLRYRLLREGRLTNKCWCCGIVDWQGKPLTVQLDHINGDARDNRLENLRMLCPNCHSQTETFGGRRFKKAENLCVCGKKIQRRSQRCSRCSSLHREAQKRKKAPECVM